MHSPGYAKKKETNMIWLRTKDKKKEPEVINEIFSQLKSRLEEDKFWYNIFENASFNIFPKFFSFKDNTLYYIKNNKSQMIKLREDILQSLELCIAFFKDCGGFKSNMDDEKEQLIIENSLQTQKDICDCTWSEIIKKKTREILLITFVINISKRFSLDTITKKSLIMTINNGIKLKIITNENIILNKGRIDKIENLSFNGTDFFISGYQEKYKKNIRKKGFVEIIIDEKNISLQKFSQPNLLASWKKYMSSFLNTQTNNSKKLTRLSLVLKSNLSIIETNNS